MAGREVRCSRRRLALFRGVRSLLCDRGPREVGIRIGELWGRPSEVRQNHRGIPKSGVSPCFSRTASRHSKRSSRMQADGGTVDSLEPREGAALGSVLR